MSFLTGRIAAGREGVYFLQESKETVTRLAQKANPTAKKNSASEPNEYKGDVLPEILRHSLPSKIFYEPTDASSLSKASKWVLPKDPNASSIHPDALNPLRAYLTLPQVTFGPKRWQIPEVEEKLRSASTANDLRRDKNTHVSPEKLKAAAEGLSYGTKAITVATGVVFGGAALTITTISFKLGLHSSEDIRTKGKDMVQPKVNIVRKQLKNWGENMVEKWHLDEEELLKEKPIVKELKRILGANTTR